MILKRKVLQFVIHSRFTFFLIGFVVSHACNVFVDGLWSLAWVSYVTFAACGGGVRTKFRNRHSIGGNPVEDFFACLLAYPLVATQLHYKEFTKQIEILPLAAPKLCINNNGFDSGEEDSNTAKL